MRTNILFKLIFICLLTVIEANGQQPPPLAALIAESLRVREAAKSCIGPNPESDHKLIVPVKQTLGNWIESRLPKSNVDLDREFSMSTPVWDLLKSKWSSELESSGLTPPEIDESDPRFAMREFVYGYVGRLELLRPKEYPQGVVIIAGVSVDCGSDDTVYVYDYSQGSPIRVVESNGTWEGFESITATHFSERTAEGEQLFLALRDGTRCASVWTHVSYDLYSVSDIAGSVLPILSGRRSFFDDEYLKVRLKPDELLMEFPGGSIDGAQSVRTYLLHYNIKGNSVQRINPVALQPQDFVEEWVTRSWTEMEQRSAHSERKQLKEWHEIHGGDSFQGEFDLVQRCTERADHWQVSVNGIYFLVHELRKYEYEMVDVSDHRQSGCPGESYPVSERPSLF